MKKAWPCAARAARNSRITFSAEPCNERRCKIPELRCSPLGLRFLKVFILKNIWSGAHQPEAHLQAAGVACGKCVAAQHHHFMRATVIAVVDDFINPGFTHGLACAEKPARASGLLAGMRA